MMAKYWYISFVVGILVGIIVNYVPGVSGAGLSGVIPFCLILVIAFSVTAIIKELKEIEEILEEKRR